VLIDSIPLSSFIVSSMLLQTNLVLGHLTTTTVVATTPPMHLPLAQARIRNPTIVAVTITTKRLTTEAPLTTGTKAVPVIT
jgi:hypothetical protein